MSSITSAISTKWENLMNRKQWAVGEVSKCMNMIWGISFNTFGWLYTYFVQSGTIHGPSIRIQSSKSKVLSIQVY